MKNTLAAAELEFMSFFWASDGEKCKKDLVEEFSKKGKSGSNISFFLYKLTKKGFLISRREGRNFYYKPSISKLEYEQFLINNNLSKTYGQSLEMILANFCGRESLNERELENVREWLKDLEKELGDTK
ncbi:MAG: hypothetical protein HFG66_18815 [Hungatella sp.]|nr:hypothetical protein [Hungatella sp.]